MKSIILTADQIDSVRTRKPFLVKLTKQPKIIDGSAVLERKRKFEFNRALVTSNSMATNSFCPYAVFSTYWVKEAHSFAAKLKSAQLEILYSVRIEYSDFTCSWQDSCKDVPLRDPIPKPDGRYKQRSAVHMEEWASRMVIKIDSIEIVEVNGTWFWSITAHVDHWKCI